MKTRKDKAYTPPYGIKMGVNVLESYKDLLERNDKAIRIVSKGKIHPIKIWKRQ